MQKEFTTGDPFVDVGQSVLELLMEQPTKGNADQPAELVAFDWASRIYITDWQGKLHGFFLNSSITNPSNKGKEKERARQQYEKIFRKQQPAAKGICRISGKEDALYAVGRESMILSGSNAFINFHHGFEGGLMAGSEALFATFFTPLGCVQVGDKIALIHSNRNDVTRYLAEINYRWNTHPTQILEPGLAKAKAGNPANAIFEYADKILGKVEDKELDERAEGLDDGLPTSLTLYHFTNFGAKPEVVVYSLSAVLFDFYRVVNYPENKKTWSFFVRDHYRNSKFKGAKAATNSETLAVPGKKGVVEEVGEDIYKGWFNDVYRVLLKGDNLLPIIKNWAIKRGRILPFPIISYYCKNILLMEQQTLDLIMRLAKHLAQEDPSRVKKTLTRLKLARNESGVRIMLLNTQYRNYKMQEKPDTETVDGSTQEPFIRLDEYVRYLFPEGGDWRKTRDLLLISVYEQLHDLGKEIPVLDEEAEEEYGNEGA